MIVDILKIITKGIKCGCDIFDESLWQLERLNIRPPKTMAAIGLIMVFNFIL